MHELVISNNEKTFLAIDIGSNAMRASMACLDKSNDLEILSTLRFPLRLGEEVFKEKRISKKKITSTLNAFQEIHTIIEKYKFKKVTIAATSALRDAENGKEVIDLVKKEVGLHIKIIDGTEEARLIQLAVASSINLKSQCALLVDIGGGSTELTLCNNGQILFTKSYQCGTVRLLESGSYKKQKEMIRDFVQISHKDMIKILKENPIEMCIGTGGNLRRMGKLRKIFFKRSNLKVTQTELSSILEEIKQFTIEQRMDYLGMREDRADVIIPACKIIEEVLLQFNQPEILLPKVGLKEGLILDSLKKKPRHIFFT